MLKLESRWRFTALILLLWGAYCGITLLTPQDPAAQKYQLSALSLNLLIVSVSLPYLICWLFATSGWLHLREFAHNQPRGPERDGFTKIAYGLLALVASLVVPTLVRAVYVYISHNPTSAGWNIFNNYMGIFFPLLGFLLMFMGSLQIVSQITSKVTRIAKATTVFFPVVLFSIFYLFMIFANPTRQTSLDPSVQPTYFLPDNMIITTIILPVIATWFLGLLLVLNLEHYSHYSKTINRLGLVSFYNGIIIIVATTILTQVLASLGNSRFANLNLGVLLAIIYVFLGLLALGFGLIARGAKKLQSPISKDESG